MERLFVSLLGRRIYVKDVLDKFNLDQPSQSEPAAPHEPVDVLTSLAVMAGMVVVAIAVELLTKDAKRY